MARNATAFMVAGDDPRRTEPGACQFIRTFGTEDRIGIIHACPCGCGGRSAMYFRGKGGGSQEWDVEGEWPNVTCKPSVGIKPITNGAYHWHGFLKKGVFVEK